MAYLLIERCDRNTARCRRQERLEWLGWVHEPTISSRLHLKQQQQQGTMQGTTHRITPEPPGRGKTSSAAHTPNALDTDHKHNHHWTDKTTKLEGGGGEESEAACEVVAVVLETYVSWLLDW